MKITAINFKERKIENCYNYDIIVLHFPDNWLDWTINQQNQWFDSIKDFIFSFNCKNALIELRYCGETALSDMEQLQIISKVASATMLNESTNIDYMSIPLYFKERVFSSVDTQRNLGNFKNHFEMLQIDLYQNEELIEHLVV